MGYRSCVGILLYGTPDKVDMVENFLMQSFTEDYDREMFDRCRQIKDKEIQKGEVMLPERTILWTFDDIKWYSEMQRHQSNLFEWVEQINSEHKKDENSYHRLEIEFVRFGENNDDAEEEYSDGADYRMYITRSIELPDDLEWKC